MPASVALHLVVAIFLLFDLPLELPTPPKEQAVSVELVPPPEVKQEKKAEAKKAEEKKAEPKKGEEKKAEQPKSQPQPKPVLKPQPLPKPTQQAPSTFASAMAKAKQENKETELPPTAETSAKKAEQPDQVKAAGEPAKARDEPTKAPAKQDETPAGQKKPLPTLAVPGKTPQAATDEKPPVTAAELKPEPKDAQSSGAKPREEKSKAKPTEVATKVDINPAPSKLTEAKVLYSEKAIADPRFKQALLQLPRKVRISQLCTGEAFEQIRHQRPETQGLVPFGPKGGFIYENRMEASGGAYHTKSDWYDVDFKCLLNEDATEVVSFSIAIGNDIVPKSTWKARRLQQPPG